jgi:hypothetical protein
MKRLLVILFMSPVFAYTQVPDTCFTQQEIHDISNTLDSLWIADSINNNLISAQQTLIDSKNQLNRLDSLHIQFQNKKIELLEDNIKLYVEREKYLKPKWYDSKIIYFSSGILTAILTSKLIVEVVK